MKLNIPSINLESSTEGAWKPFPLMPSIKVKIARSGNKASVEFRKKLIQGYRDAGQKELTDSDYESISVKLYAETIIRDWKGITSGKKTLKYTVENALEILNDSQYEEFYSFIIRESLEIENYRNEVRKEDEKKQ